MARVLGVRKLVWNTFIQAEAIVIQLNRSTPVSFRNSSLKIQQSLERMSTSFLQYFKACSLKLKVP